MLYDINGRLTNEPSMKIRAKVDCFFLSRAKVGILQGNGMDSKAFFTFAKQSKNC